MRLVRGYVNPPAATRGAVVAIGNFDGLHKGHQALVRTAHETALQTGAPLGLVTFEPHPRRVFQPEIAPFRLISVRSKLRVLNALGIDVAVSLRFNRDFAAISADDFAKNILGNALDIRHVVVGYDFAFGNQRRGNPDLLVRVGEVCGYGVTVIDPQGDGREIFSSSRIRDFLVQGRLAEATNELGRFWEIEGHVQHGDARGASIGFPTANLRLGELIRPALGVYAVRAKFSQNGDSRWHDGVANLGRRPTFGGEDIILEVHLLNFEGDLYGTRMRVALIDYLRPEQKFGGIDALKAQIEADCARARRLFDAKRVEPGWFEQDNLPLAINGRNDRR